MANRKELLMTMVKALASDDNIKNQKIAEAAFHKQAAARTHCILENVKLDDDMEIDFSVPTDDVSGVEGDVVDEPKEDCCTCTNCGAQVDTPFCGQCGTENENYEEEGMVDDDSAALGDEDLGGEFATDAGEDELTADDLNIR